MFFLLLIVIFFSPVADLPKFGDRCLVQSRILPARSRLDLRCRLMQESYRCRKNPFQFANSTRPAILGVGDKSALDGLAHS